MKDKISISSIASVSPLGIGLDDVWATYKNGNTVFKERSIGDKVFKVAEVSLSTENKLKELRKSKAAYKKLDRTVLLSILAARELNLSTNLLDSDLGINIGSSRGATHLFEKYFQDFQEGQKISAYTSPTTTLGNISSWVGQDLGIDGIRIDHSVTCSTSMHAILNGIAWLKADMASSFIVGGSEAALTPFTLAQMQALKLYSKSVKEFPCESMRFDKSRNSMVLGEGAALACLEKGVSNNTVAVISGYGFASEKIEHNSAISENATCFQDSMRKALSSANLKTVDAIVMHAPGTVKGDKAEKNAIDIVFGNTIPFLTSNKWMVGHTFATSGILSIEMGILMLQKQELLSNPFFTNPEETKNKSVRNIMINAVGFGGNAVSIIISKPDFN